MSSKGLYEQIPIADEAADSNGVSSDLIRGQSKRFSWFQTGLFYHFIFICLYTLLTTVVIRRQTRSYDVHNGSTAFLQSWSPGQSAVRYKSVVFNAAPNLTSPYVGESSPELDQEWHELLKYTNMRVSEDDLRRAGRESIPLGVGGGFYGEMAVFHELHCLKFLRQAYHMDYYGSRFGQEEKNNMGEHTEHCIELLRQGVMCRGDTTLITFKWGHVVKLPQPDFTLQHQCVDWDHLMKWAKDHAINVFEEGMLVHPKLGPSYPGGFREDRPHPPP